MYEDEFVSKHQEMAKRTYISSLQSSRLQHDIGAKFVKWNQVNNERVLF